MNRYPLSCPSLADQRLHFLGIGGTGMSALAELALGRGAKVSGCDRE
ncbi:MAG: Mur ligase domain-containing protein, partial [Planctomycetota bacterium]|nr:Mur ligase domain-containing protein [Planctomycetota bacterium]